MSNTFLTPTEIANRALATLYNTTVLLPLVNRDYENEYAAGKGATVTYRKPATFVAKDYVRSTGIELQDVVESSGTVVLDTHLDVSIPITAEELTLDIGNFGEQILTPAMEAISQEVDARIAEALIDQAQAHTPDWVADGQTNPNDAFRSARAILSRAKMPLTNRYAVMSPEAIADALGDDLLVTANQSGSTDALRNANIGRVFGFDTYETQVFGYGDGDRGTADGVAFHRDAISFVSRPLALPLGNNNASISSYKGLGLRVVYDYDIDKKQDVLSVDLLCGIDNLRSDGCVELEFGQGS